MRIPYMALRFQSQIIKPGDCSFRNIYTAPVKQGPGNRSIPRWMVLSKIQWGDLTGLKDIKPPLSWLSFLPIP